MKLLPIWKERVQDVELEPAANRISYGLKKSPRYYSVKTNFIETVDDAQSMLDFALQRPLLPRGEDCHPDLWSAVPFFFPFTGIF